MLVRETRFGEITMTTKSEIIASIVKIQKMVRDLPPETPQMAHTTLHYLLSVCEAYQEWVNELQAIIVSLEEDNGKLKSTIDTQIEMIRNQFKNHAKSH